jgi:3-phenylpropionate/trans-cinnamate dioxygenase ferredoxin subunit
MNRARKRADLAKFDEIRPLTRGSSTHEGRGKTIMSETQNPNVKITALENGPLKVEGGVEIFWDNGTPVESKKKTVYLCRCGASVKKPFCDGTHSKIGFQAAAAAVPESAE